MARSRIVADGNSEHARNVVPLTLGDPGLEDRHPEQHIARDIGLLFNRHEALSYYVRDALETEAAHLHSKFNEPYRVCDHEEYTNPVHGVKRGIPNMLFEVRNDHIENEIGQQLRAELPSGILKRVAPRLKETGNRQTETCGG